MITRELPQPPLRDQLGYLRRMFVDPQPVLDEITERFGRVWGLGFGPVRLAVIGDPSTLRAMFAIQNESYRWGHKFNVLGFVVGKGSMIVSDGEDHRRRRSSVQAAFSIRRLNSWVPMILDRTDVAIDRLEASLGGGQREIDMYPVGRRIVLEVVIHALFGEHLAARAEEIGDLFQRPQAYLESPAFRQAPHPFPFGRRARVRDDRRALDAIIDNEIAARRQHPSGDPRDVLETLVSDHTLSDAEIRDQVVTLIGAGYDTTAASLAWMLVCSARQPGLWDRLAVEADTTLGHPGTSTVAPDRTTLASLDLAGRVMHETLRLHPAGAITPREAAVDLEVDGYRIPKGTLVLWSAHLAGRDPAAWTDATRFDLDRFADLTPDQQALVDRAWVPFGRGHRACIGFALAQMELTLMISRLAQRLTLEPATSDYPRPVGMVVNRPAGGVPMHVGVRATRAE